MIYLDANAFVYAFIYADKRADHALELLDNIVRGKENAATSALTYDEVIWAVRKIGGREKSLEAGDAFLSIRNLTIIPVDSNTIQQAHTLSKRYNISPRDAIHAGTCIQKNIPTIYSEDTVFDQIKEIKRKWHG